MSGRPGTGATYDAIAGRYDARPGCSLGVDLSEGVLALARARAPGRVAAGDLRRLPIADRSVDGVWSAYALHLDDDELALAVAEVARVLRRDGPAVLVLASDDRPVVLRDREQGPCGREPEQHQVHPPALHLHQVRDRPSGFGHVRHAARTALA